MFGRARVRLALFYTGALVLILAAVGVSAYLILRDQLDGDINSSLRSAAAGLRTTPVFAPPPGGDDHDPRHYPDQQLRTPLSTDIFYVLLGPDGTVLNNPRGVGLDGFPLDQLAVDGISGNGQRDFSGEDHHYRVLSTLSNDPRNPGLVLVVGRSLDARDHQLDVLLVVMLVGGLAGTALATAGGFWLAGRALVPIQRALETQRRFVSDASHELRTPVAVMKANAELLMRHPHQTIDANTDQLEAINEEADHMAGLVGDLLTLARADEQRMTLAHEPVDLAGVLEGVVRDMGAVAQGRGLALRSSSPARPSSATNNGCASWARSCSTTRLSSRQPADRSRCGRGVRGTGRPSRWRTPAKGSAGRPAAGLRPVLPLGRGALTGGRDRAWPGHRPMNSGGARRPDHGGVRAGPRRDVHRAAAGGPATRARCGVR